MVPDTVSKRLKLPKLGQLGYVVADLDKTLAYYKDILGITPWLLLHERPSPCIERGEEVHPFLKIALAYMGPVQVELIQVLEGQSVHLEHVRKSPGGVHHLGFMVRNLEKRLDACRRMGIRILQRGTISDLGFTVDYAYLDTVDEAGIIIEFIQWHVGRIPVPINRAVHRVMARAGAGTLLKGRVIR